MSEFTFAKSLYPFSLGLSLLSAIALSLPQSVQAQSLTLSQQQPLNTLQELLFPAPEATPISSNNGIASDRTVPISEWPAEVANPVLESVAQTLGLPVSSLQITSSVHQVTWTDGCMGVYRPFSMCTSALVDG